jgi:hypothetical protein
LFAEGFYLVSAALGKGLIHRVPDEMLSAKIFALGKGAVSGSVCRCPLQPDTDVARPIGSS